MARYMLDVAYPDQPVKTYSFTTWERRSQMIRQLPQGCQIKAYEKPTWLKEENSHETA